MKLDIERAIEVMTPEDQSVLVPHFIYGFSCAEIGAVLGIHRRTVAERIQKALKRTRHAMKRKHG